MGVETVRKDGTARTFDFLLNRVWINSMLLLLWMTAAAGTVRNSEVYFTESAAKNDD